MGSYKWETHLHTREGSACATGSGAEMVHAHLEAGYAGMVVTDHFFNGNTAIPAELPWEDRINEFCLGFDHAREEARGTGFVVLFGWEYSYLGTEFLTYGLRKDWLLAHPDLLSWPVEHYLKEVHAAGGFVSHAHPFREAPYIAEIRLFPELVDAVEVCNGSHKNPDWDRRACSYARVHQLAMTKGSDTHHADFLVGGGMVFEQTIYDNQDLIEAIRKWVVTPDPC